MNPKTWHAIAVIFGILASVSVILGIAVFEGYLSVASVDNITADEWFVLGALSIVVAILAYAEE
jgi:hypothetical protein